MLEQKGFEPKHCYLATWQRLHNAIKNTESLISITNQVKTWTPVGCTICKTYINNLGYI